MVSSKQVRFSSKVYTARASDSDPAIQLSLKNKLAKLEKKEIWHLSRVEKIVSRSPSSLPHEFIKVHESDDGDVMSEYVEMDEGSNDFDLHFFQLTN